MSEVHSDMTQVADWPAQLGELVSAVRYKPRWEFVLEDMDRGQGSEGLTLIITINTPDAYHPEKMRRVSHLFPVPPAAYDMRSWRRWLFDRIGDVDTHERCEFFQIVTFRALDSADGEPRVQSVTRPYAPSHGFGQDPYLVREIGTEQDVKTSYRNVVKE